ncbi:hypothetical protein LSM04_000678 [Trypanosoma melophagium]|uniref:uncharacterized protein n=1 Tax=Trypanosoma melophagium TaxID=715481 RepID=UPI00351A7462|nr:hypothetical protein LSM04_000678 [Trypanosoma melophagium]
MLRTAILFKRVVAVKKRAPVVKARLTYTTQELTKLQRKRENEAERIFLAKIAEGRMRRKKIIADALNRALRKEKKKETSLLLQYEANKAKASEELGRMKEKAQESLSAEIIPVVVSHTTPKKSSSSKPRITLRKDTALQKAGELEAERNFFQMIEDLKRKREDELKLLTEKKTQELNESKVTVVEKEEEGDNITGDRPDVAAIIKTELTVESQTIKREPKRVKERVKELKEVKETPLVTPAEDAIIDNVVATATKETFAKVEERTQEPHKLKKEMTRAVKEKKVKSETPRERSPRKGQVNVQAPEVHKEVTTIAAPTPIPVVEVTSTNTSVVSPPRPTVVQHPIHAFSLAGFNEPPLFPPPRSTIDAGRRRLSALPSLDSPMIPLRSRPLDAFLPVARVAPNSPLSFPPNVQPMLPTRHRQVTNTGLHRL